MKNNRSEELVLNVISLGIFVTAAILGWYRIQYGFNFIDEGWQMTEAWRITAGDDFLKDRFTGAIRNSPLINAMVFKLYPEITLLGFRKLYLLLTLLALLFFTMSMHKSTDDKIFFYPILFSIFAFTGLDVTGISTYLNYHTYPHLFLTFHLSFLILGITRKDDLFRKILLFLSGIFLWFIGFVLLHLSLTIVSILFIFVMFKLIRTHPMHFNWNDALVLLTPSLLLWSVLIIILGKNYIDNVVSSLQLAFSVPTYRMGLLLSINWEYSKLILAALFFIIIFLLSTRIVHDIYLLCVQAVFSVLMLIVLKTNIWGIYHGGTNGASWFSALLISSSLLFLLHFTVKALKKETFDKNDVIHLLLFISGITSAINGIFFSSLGMLIAVYSSIPLTAAICFSILSFNTLQKRPLIIRWLIIVFFWAPFFSAMAYERWQFNFYDVSPRQATATIDEGFCKGIKTNQIYKNLHNWIRKTSAAYSTKNDFIISYVSSPMVHMIAQRRPAADDSYIAFDVMPQSYYEKALAFLKTRDRKPRLVYVFEAMPALIPLNSNGSYFALWMEKQITFPSDDPFSDYVIKNMTLIERFTISEELSIYARCFIDKASRSSNIEKPIK